MFLQHLHPAPTLSAYTDSKHIDTELYIWTIHTHIYSVYIYILYILHMEASFYRDKTS